MIHRSNKTSAMNMERPLPTPNIVEHRGWLIPWYQVLLILAIAVVVGVVWSSAISPMSLLMNGDFSHRLLRTLQTDIQDAPMSDGWWVKHLYLFSPLGCGLSLFHRALFWVFSPDSAMQAAMVAKLAGLTIFTLGIVGWGIAVGRLVGRTGGLVMVALCLMSPISLAYAMQAGTEPLAIGLPGLAMAAWVIWWQTGRIRWLLIAAVFMLLASMVRVEAITMAFGLWLVTIPRGRWWSIVFGAVSAAYVLLKLVYWTKLHFAGSTLRSLLRSDAYDFGPGKAVALRMWNQIVVEHVFLFGVIAVSLAVAAVGAILCQVLKKQYLQRNGPTGWGDKMQMVAAFGLPGLMIVGFHVASLLRGVINNQPRYIGQDMPWIAGTVLVICWISWSRWSQQQQRLSDTVIAVGVAAVLLFMTVPSFVIRASSYGPGSGDRRWVGVATEMRAALEFLDRRSIEAHDIVYDSMVRSPRIALYLSHADDPFYWPYKVTPATRSLIRSALTRKQPPGTRDFQLGEGLAHGSIYDSSAYVLTRSKALWQLRKGDTFDKRGFVASWIWPFLTAENDGTGAMRLNSPYLPSDADVVLIPEMEWEDSSGNRVSDMVLWRVQVDGKTRGIADTQPGRLHWQQDGPLPNGKINAGSAVTMDTTATPPVEVLSPATSENSLYRLLDSAVTAGDQVRGQVTLSSDTPLHIRLFIARNDKTPWEASQREITIGPSPTTHTISHTFKSPHQDARLQIALLSNADTLMIHDASVQLVTPSCDWHVIAVSTLPDPQTADYADCLDVMHLKRPDSCDEPHEALVALRTMTDRTLTTAANIKLGDLLAIDTLTPWSETPESIRSIRTVQDMDEFHLPMYFGDGSKVVGQRAPSASTVTQRPVEANADGTLAPAPSQGQTQWIADDLAAINQIAADHGGWQKWADSLATLREEVVLRTPNHISYVNQDWVDRKSRARWLLQSSGFQSGHNQVWFPEATSSILATAGWLNEKGIDLIVVPVPSRAELYCEKYGGEKGINPAPHRLRFHQHLLENGVEVVDLFSALTKARASESPQDPVAYSADHHWASRGLVAAAEEISKRLVRYSDQDPPTPHQCIEKLGAEWTNMNRHHGGSIDPPWTRSLRTIVRTVDPRDIPNADSKHIPVLIASDSLGNMYGGSTGGGLGAHLSRLTGLSTTTTTAASGGPTAPTRLANDRSALLTNRKVVVWIFVSHYLVQKPWSMPPSNPTQAL